MDFLALHSQEAGVAFLSLVLSFMSSASEAAIYHLPRGGRSTALSNRLRVLLRRPYQLSDVLRTVDFFADVSFLFVLGLMLRSWSSGPLMGDVALLVGGVLVLFLVTEVLPRALASRYPVVMLWTSLLPLEVFYRLLVPLSWGTRWLVNLLLSPLEARFGGGGAPDEEELRAVLGFSARSGGLGEDGVGMVEGILDLDETRVRAVMTPRTQIVFLEDDAMWDQALAVFAASPYRRLPVKRRGGEEIVGILYAKDMLAAQLRGECPDPLELVREPLYIPGVAYLDDALNRLREAGNQLAVVVDEYGGTEGLLSMEDILEEIVGEIRDEHDEREALEDAQAVRLADGVFDLDGTLELEELGDLLGLDLEEEPVETLAGLVFHACGALPEVGEEVAYRGYLFRVTERDRFRIARVQARKQGAR
jgi:CBS domain containing-hemolysin-like protein